MAANSFRPSEVELIRYLRKMIDNGSKPFDDDDAWCDYIANADVYSVPPWELVRGKLAPKPGSNQRSGRREWYFSTKLSNKCSNKVCPTIASNPNSRWRNEGRDKVDGTDGGVWRRLTFEETPPRPR